MRHRGAAKDKAECCSGKDLLLPGEKWEIVHEENNKDHQLHEGCVKGRK